MGEHLELWDGGRSRVVGLDQPRLSVGRHPDNDVALDDEQISRTHAVLDRLAGGWAVTDLGSTNGTYVNGERLTGPRLLHHGDELRLGTFRALLWMESPDASTTAVADPAPSLTPREKEVLVTLCRPILSSDAFSAPTAVREISEQLFVGVGAVKQHLGNLYEKFGIEPGGERRAKLANAAIRTGAVTMADLRDDR